MSHRYLIQWEWVTFLGSRVARAAHRGAGTRVIQAAHGLDERAIVLGREQPPLSGCGEQARAQRFGEEDVVSGLRAGVGPHTLRVHSARDSKTVLELSIAHGVTAAQDRARCTYYFVTAHEDLAQHLGWQGVFGKADNVQGNEGAAPHGVDIGEGVGSSDAPKLHRVIDDGCEEIHGLHEGKVIAQAYNCSVVSVVKADEKPGVIGGGESRQCAAQRNRREFSRSAGGLDRMGQPFVLLPTHRGSVTARGRNGWSKGQREQKRAAPSGTTRFVMFVFATTLAAPATFLDDLRRRDASGLSGTS